MRIARGLVVAVAATLVALFAAGCVLAAHFEASGFGSPRDSEPRIAYLVALAFAFVASVGVPFALWRRLLPDRAPGWAFAAVLAIVGVVAILGISPLSF